MSDAISERIAKELGALNLSDSLSQLSGSDLHSLMLSVMKRRVANIETSSLVHDSKVTRACNVDGRLLNKLDGIAFDTASEFEVVELSPLQPLGSVGALTGLDQGNVLTTIRAYECASDPTVGLALECARRRKDVAQRKQTMRLCSSHRVVRFPVPDKPGFSAHFRLFCLVSSARDQGSFLFETIALWEHIRVYLLFLNQLAKPDFTFSDVTVEISDTRAISHLCASQGIDRDEIKRSVRARDSDSSDKVLQKYSSLWPKNVIRPHEELAQFDLPQHILKHLSIIDEKVRASLQNEFPMVNFAFNMHRLTGLGYYHGPCFHIKLKNKDGQSFMLADGGFVNWTQLLLQDGKERLMTSAIGVELFCRMFRS